MCLSHVYCITDRHFEVSNYCFVLSSCHSLSYKSVCINPLEAWKGWIWRHITFRLVHDPLTDISNEETFINIFKYFWSINFRINRTFWRNVSLDNDVIIRLKYSITRCHLFQLFPSRQDLFSCVKNIWVIGLPHLEQHYMQNCFSLF